MSPVFAALDADHDGTVSAAELANAPAALKAHRSQRRWGAVGRRDPSGVRAWRTRRSRRSRPRRAPVSQGETPATSPDELAATLMGFDKDSDGKLTKAELPERLQGLFDRADADKDNALTADEIKKSATSMTNPSADGRGEGREGEGRRGGRGPGGPMGRDPLVATLDADRDGAISAGEIGRRDECASRARRQRGWPADAGGSPAVRAWTGRPAPPFLTRERTSRTTPMKLNRILLAFMIPLHLRARA